MGPGPAAQGCVNLRCAALHAATGHVGAGAEGLTGPSPQPWAPCVGARAVAPGARLDDWGSYAELVGRDE